MRFGRGVLPDRYSALFGAKTRARGVRVTAPLIDEARTAPLLMTWHRRIPATAGRYARQTRRNADKPDPIFLSSFQAAYLIIKHILELEL